MADDEEMKFLRNYLVKSGYNVSDSEDWNLMTNVKLPALGRNQPRLTTSRKGSRYKNKDEKKTMEDFRATPKLDSRNLSRASFKPPPTFRKSSVIHENFKKAFDPSEPYDFDESDEESDGEKKGAFSTLKEQCLAMYRRACRQAGIIPVKSVLRQFGQQTFTVRDLSLPPRDLKAIFKAVSFDTEVIDLDLSGNTIGVKEINYICQILSLNKTLTCLSLKSCKLCGKPISTLGDFLSKSNTLRRLDLSDNEFGDSDAVAIANIIEHNESIGELVLSHNKLGDSGVLIGNAIRDNEIMTSIDLSWNHIRGYGAIGIAKGLAHNNKLVTVILAWNGFGFEGCAAMADSLACNSNIQKLDLSCNRIHPPALFELIKGLEKNKTLSTIRLAHNPITASMTSILLNRIFKAKESNLKELDIEGVVVSKDFKEVLDELQKERMFIVRHDLALPINKTMVHVADSKNIFNIDPIRILYFMKEHLRTIDLFLKFDKDNSNSLTRDEMQFAFEVEGFPISSAALDSVMSYLDTNNDGSVDLLIPTLDAFCEFLENNYPGTYREFIDGERRLKRKMIKEKEDEAQEALNSNNPGGYLSSKDKHSYSKSFEPAKSPRVGFPKIS